MTRSRPIKRFPRFPWLGTFPLMGILCLGLCAPASARAEDTVRTANPHGHLEYFGFYASAMGRWNFTRELAPFTNLTWIHVGSGDDPAAGAREIVARVAEAEEAGVQAVVALAPYLFVNEAGLRRPDAEIEAFLVDLRARLENRGLVDTVAMLYPKDEPFREFRRHRDPDVIEEYVTGEVYEDIHADLTHVNRLVKLVFPEKPLGVILSGLELHHRFFSIPESYDWVGFDCYANLFDACEGRSFVQLYGRLLANMAPHQRLMAVPEAWALHGETTNPLFPERLAERLALHWEMALAEPRFVAFVPFLWSFEAPEATPGVGLDRFPEFFDTAEADRGTAFLERVKDLGLQVKTGAPRYPNLVWSETEADHRPTGAIQGQLLDVSEDGRVTVRALDTALPHKNLRVRVALRDAAGNTLFKTRMTRTNLPAPIPVPDRPDDGLLLGTHDLEVQLPRDLLARHRGETLEVLLHTYADGPGARLADVDTQSLPLSVEGSRTPAADAWIDLQRRLDERQAWPRAMERIR